MGTHWSAAPVNAWGPWEELPVSLLEWGSSLLPRPPATQLYPICSAGRTLRPSPDAWRIFREFVKSKMPETGRIIFPPHVGRREFIFPFLLTQSLCSGYFSYTRVTTGTASYFTAHLSLLCFFVPLQRPASWSKIPSALSERCRTHSGGGSWSAG